MAPDNKTTGGFLAFGKRDFVPKRTTTKTKGGRAKKNTKKPTTALTDRSKDLVGAPHEKGSLGAALSKPSTEPRLSSRSFSDADKLAASSAAADRLAKNTNPNPASGPSKPLNFRQKPDDLGVAAPSPASGGQPKGIRSPETTNPDVRPNFTVDVASPVASAPTSGPDDRTQLKRAVAARIAFARSVNAGRGPLSPQDQAALNDFKDQEAFYRNRLALAHRVNTLSNIDRINRGPDGRIDPQLAIERASALDEQIRPAQLSAAESLGQAAQRRMELASRFPQAQGRADEAVRNFADATGRIDNSGATPFADAARANSGTRDFAAEIQLARQARDQLQKPQNILDLEARGGLPQDQFDQQSLERAQVEANKRIADQVAGGQPGDAIRLQTAGLQPGTPLTNEQRDDLDALFKTRIGGQTSAAGAGQTIQGLQNQNAVDQAIAANDPDVSPIVTELPSVISRVLNDRGLLDFTIDDSARNRLVSLLDQIDTLTPEQRRAAVNTIRQEMLGQGFDPSRLSRSVVTPFHFVGRQEELQLENLRNRLSQTIFG